MGVHALGEHLLDAQRVAHTVNQRMPLLREQEQELAQRTKELEALRAARDVEVARARNDATFEAVETVSADAMRLIEETYIPEIERLEAEHRTLLASSSTQTQELVGLRAQHTEHTAAAKAMAVELTAAAATETKLVETTHKLCRAQEELLRAHTEKSAAETENANLQEMLDVLKKRHIRFETLREERQALADSPIEDDDAAQARRLTRTSQHSIAQIA